MTEGRYAVQPFFDAILPVEMSPPAERERSRVVQCGRELLCKKLSLSYSKQTKLPTQNHLPR